MRGLYTHRAWQSTLGQNRWQLASQSIPSWNQIIAWLREWKRFAPLQLSRQIRAREAANSW